MVKESRKSDTYRDSHSEDASVGITFVILIYGDEDGKVHLLLFKWSVHKFTEDLDSLQDVVLNIVSNFLKTFG